MDIGSGITFGPGIYIQPEIVVPLLYGQQSYTTAGTYSWVAPNNVTSVSVICIGGGGSGNHGWGGFNLKYGAAGGGGGGLGWKNNITVVPGQSYTVVVGSPGADTPGGISGNGTAGTDSYFINTSTVKGGAGGAALNNTPGAGGSYVGDGGGNGGSGGSPGEFYPGGGGGAGGYTGNGGDGGSASDIGNAGSGGGGGGGSGDSTLYSAGGGGGVGIFGAGTSGAGGAAAREGGSGGSGGTNGSLGTVGASVHSYGGNAGIYGGGGGGAVLEQSSALGGNGGVGAVRIIWGNYNANSTISGARAFPSTLTGEL